MIRVAALLSVAVLACGKDEPRGTAPAPGQPAPAAGKPLPNGPSGPISGDEVSALVGEILGSDRTQLAAPFARWQLGRGFEIALAAKAAAWRQRGAKLHDILGDPNTRGALPALEVAFATDLPRLAAVMRERWGQPDHVDAGGLGTWIDPARHVQVTESSRADAAVLTWRGYRSPDEVLAVDDADPGKLGVAALPLVGTPIAALQAAAAQDSPVFRDSDTTYELAVPGPATPIKVELVTEAAPPNRVTLARLRLGPDKDATDMLLAAAARKWGSAGAPGNAQTWQKGALQITAKRSVQAQDDLVIELTR